MAEPLESGAPDIELTLEADRPAEGPAELPTLAEQRYFREQAIEALENVLREIRARRSAPAPASTKSSVSGLETDLGV